MCRYNKTILKLIFLLLVIHIKNVYHTITQLSIFDKLAKSLNNKECFKHFINSAHDINYATKNSLHCNQYQQIFIGTISVIDVCIIGMTQGILYLNNYKLNIQALYCSIY